MKPLLILKKAACAAAAAILCFAVFSPAVYGLRSYDQVAQDYPEFSALTDDNPVGNMLIVKTDGTLPDFRTLHPSETVQGPDNVYVVTFSDAETAADSIPLAASLRGVEFAEQNGIVRAQGEALTEYKTWGMKYMKAEAFAKQLHDRGDLASVTVAVVDSGVKASEPIFRDRLVEGKTFLGSPCTQDDYGHGTAVAGIVADCTQNLPVQIMPIKILNADGSGTLLNASNGVKYAADNGVGIINLSFVSDSCSLILHDAVDYAVENGCLPIISAGNSGRNMANSGSCPADYAPGFTVSGCDENGGFYPKSCFGPTVDVCAPAMKVSCTTIYGETRALTGTSFAAPHVTAVAAMFKLYMPDADRAALEKMIKLNTRDLGDPGFDAKFGNGVPDLSALDGSQHPLPDRHAVSIQVV